MVAFAGWEMPVQYTGVIEEHLAVRSHAGLFDVSHMGEIEVRGASALEFCQRITANDVARLQEFQAQYNLLLNDRGGVVDDVIIYRVKPEAYFICVNASNIDKDFAWIRDHASGAVEVDNQSAMYAQLALQGPAAEAILQPLTVLKLAQLKSFNFAFTDVATLRCMVARTGYTGEDGFELYCHVTDAEKLWDALLAAGAPVGLVPVGLGARDTLRLEKAYPLYGHELDDTTTPLEAGLEWVAKLSKPSFIGREVVVQQKAGGVRRKLVGLELLQPGIARSDYQLFKNGRNVGRVTSGTKSPTLGKAIALGYVSSEESEIDNRIAVEIRGRQVSTKIVRLPFYRRNGGAKQVEGGL
ncbi:MAG: Aminomethyltransferase (glycine cleavage system protein) [Deltaproteobacteria bacterium]|nr:Aminomethyltransferase (glycine cleavage system protein) [Deltaproteobacteria bacterium]